MFLEAQKEVGVLFYKNSTQYTLLLATKTLNSWCYPGQSSVSFTWSTKHTMTLHPPTHAQNVATCNNSYVRSKPEQRSPTVFWPTTVQISLRPLAIILSKPKPLPFIIGDSITRTHAAYFCPYLANDVLNLVLTSLSETNVKFSENFWAPIDVTLQSHSGRIHFMCMCANLLRSCPSLCNPMDCSLPGSSAHGILQARILEWVAISSSRDSSWPIEWNCVSPVSCNGRQAPYH